MSALRELSVSFRGIGLTVEQLPLGHPIKDRYSDYLGCDHCEFEYGKHVVGSQVIWCPKEEGEDFTTFSPFCEDCNQPKHSGACEREGSEVPR